MTTKDSIEANLAAIRKVVDTDVTGCDIDTIVEQGKKLASIMGLSAEVMGAAQKHLQLARKKALKELESKGISPSVMIKMADGDAAMELAMYDYADRLNAAITHQLDYYRSVISLYKSELENSIKA